MDRLNNKASERLSLRISDELRNKIRFEANNQCRTESNMIKAILEEYFINIDRLKKISERK